MNCNQTGLTTEELREAIAALEERNENESRGLLKARCFAFLLEHAALHPKAEGIFQEKAEGEKLLRQMRDRWWKEAREGFAEKAERVEERSRLGVYDAIPDFGHSSSDTRRALRLGFRKLAESEKETDFYRAAKIAMNAMADFCHRYSLCPEISHENSLCLENLSQREPQTLYEAMQFLLLFFYLHEQIGGTRMRTLGRLDLLLFPFYQSDLACGRLTEEEAAALLRAFLLEISSLKILYDLPFCIGGETEEGEDASNEMTRLILEAYRSITVDRLKIHFRVSQKTPADLILLALTCIREGKCSLVFVSDDCAVRSLERVGIPRKDAWNYVLIGCYEPAVFAQEVPCTGNGKLNLMKAIEALFCNGTDHKTGIRIAPPTPEIHSEEELDAALKGILAAWTEEAMDYVRTLEACYDRVQPDPILSASLSPCMESGKEAFAGGAKYNNSSFGIAFLASFADSVAAIRRLVFREKRLSLAQLGEILKNNWKGWEDLQKEVLLSPEKFGNRHRETDAIAADYARFAAEIINGKPNGRGGVFKAGLFSIDQYVKYGALTMASPDGREEGRPLSKNLCASLGMDRKGVTALIQSATEIDHSLFPNGSVLDVVLHPSAVAGEEGLAAFYALLKTYFKRGGFALHGNVFSVEELKRAQQHPEQYAHLQVRVCGWNAYFTALKPEEQELFLRQAENAQ